jgi:hypothetical protein
VVLNLIPVEVKIVQILLLILLLMGLLHHQVVLQVRIAATSVGWRNVSINPVKLTMAGAKVGCVSLLSDGLARGQEPITLAVIV